jgi:hypothetical protein
MRPVASASSRKVSISVDEASRGTTVNEGLCASLDHGIH